jgi:hypothetical protein
MVSMPCMIAFDYLIMNKNREYGIIKVGYIHYISLLILQTWLWLLSLLLNNQIDVRPNLTNK